MALILGIDQERSSGVQKEEKRIFLIIFSSGFSYTRIRLSLPIANFPQSSVIAIVEMGAEPSLLK
jgi:hypothetical protein